MHPHLVGCSLDRTLLQRGGARHLALQLAPQLLGGQRELRRLGVLDAAPQARLAAMRVELGGAQRGGALGVCGARQRGLQLALQLLDLSVVCVCVCGGVGTCVCVCDAGLPSPCCTK